MLSLLLFKTSQPSKPFVLLQNLKAIFQPMGGKGSPLAANKKKQETQCCSGCELPHKLFQPSAFVVLLSFPCLLLLFLFLILPSIKKGCTGTWCISLMGIVSTARATAREHAERKLIHNNSVAGGSLYCSVPSNSNLSDCSAVSCNHHTHTQRKRERTGVTHWVANYRV